MGIGIVSHYNVSVTERFFPVKEKMILVTESWNEKEHHVSQYIFPVDETIFLVTGNNFPVTGRTKNTLCGMKNFSWHRRYTK